MSLKTKTRGFTAWINLRLKPYDSLLNNVLMDLLTGTNMKDLLNSFVGKDDKRINSFDGLSQQQQITRVEWFLDELKKFDIIPGDMYLDCRMFAMRSAEHVFDFLYRLVTHDIWFVWERAEYLQHNEDEILCQIPFKWNPEPPPEEKKKKKKKTRTSLLAGFGSASKIEEEDEDDRSDAVTPSAGPYEPFPGSDWVKGFKPKKKKKNADRPKPEDCILEMIHAHLKMTKEGQRLSCRSLEDLVDSRILCALMNSLMPGMFTTEVLLNDRWTVNLILRQGEKMLYASSPFDSEDLLEADSQSVTAYFCYFFMVVYKFRQSKAVVNRVDWCQRLIREYEHELSQIPPMVSSMEQLGRKKELRKEIDGLKGVIEKLQARFDVMFCYRWIKHAKEVVVETRKLVQEKMQLRWETVEVPRGISINDMCIACVINLNLTNGLGYYMVTGKEIVPSNRTLVLRDKETGDYIDETAAKERKLNIQRILKLPNSDLVELNPDANPQYEIYVEAPSRNKELKPGSYFLYQVFPASIHTWQRTLIHSARDNEIETVEKLLTFFRGHPTFINGKEPPGNNTALHFAARNGHWNIVQYLLEEGANIDAKNNFKQTPLFFAIEGNHKSVAHLLIEWGCDVRGKSVHNRTALDQCRSQQLRDFLEAEYEHYASIVPPIMEGDMELLGDVIKKHKSGEKQLCTLRSRCINGSTLLHTAAYFGAVEHVVELLSMQVEVNLRDYKGATPMHRAKDLDIMDALYEAGGSVVAVDSEGNTALHVKCYGETGKDTELEAIQRLLTWGASPAVKNNRGLLAAHCCAMQGRTDGIELLLGSENVNEMMTVLDEDVLKSPPSLPHLAVANDFLDCASWLLSNSFKFKDRELDTLVQRILADQIQPRDRQETIQFLLDNGASANPMYPGGNSALHYASSMSGGSEVMELLIMYGAEVDFANEQGCTPLFYATQCNNLPAAQILLDHGANVRYKNLQGMTAFDYIVDFDEWIHCGYFTEDIKSRLKAFNLKHARDLIRAISKKVKGSGMEVRPSLGGHLSTFHQATQISSHQRELTIPSGGSRMSTETRASFPPITSQQLVSYPTQ